jgi:hypothetical protein
MAKSLDYRVWVLVIVVAAACGKSPSNSEPAPDSGQLVVADRGPGPSSDHQLPAADKGVAPDQGPPAQCPQGASFDDAYRKVVFSAKVNGKGPFTLFYDTGAPTSAFAPSITGKKNGTSFQAQSIDLGNGVVLGPATVTTYSPILAGFPVDGIIGNDLFVGKVVTVDYGRRQFWAADTLDEAALAACSHVAGSPQSIAFQRDSGYLYVKGSVDGVQGDLLVDTGASLGAIEQFVVDQATGENPAVEGLQLDAMIGTYWSSYMLFQKMTVGTLAVEHLVTYTLPDGALPSPSGGKTLGCLPYGFMQHFMVSIDFRNQVLRLDAVKGDKLADHLFLPGYGLSLSVNATGPVTITRLVPGSPAEQAGLSKGQQVVSIDGKDPATVAPASRIDLVFGMKPGTKSTVVTTDGTQQKTYTLTSAELFPLP